MRNTELHKMVFSKGSRTYFTSSLFFPETVRREVSILYSFVRVADDFVDAAPQDREGFDAFRQRYAAALGGRKTMDPVIDDFVHLMREKGFEPGWVDAFLSSMEADFSIRQYDTLEDVERYIYGSAEVIGLFMARVLDLPQESYPYAQMLGRAMQYINFIRDIDEDARLGRRYLPFLDTGLESLDRDYAAAHPEKLRRFIDRHIGLYREWQARAEKGFAMIPRRFRIPIKTASDMYAWTARQIEQKPFVVFDRKVKPAKSRIIAKAFSNALAA
jgi:phytoene synthase